MKFFSLMALAALALVPALSGCLGRETSSFQSLGGRASAETSALAGMVRVHFNRVQKDYEGWGVFSWQGPATPAKDWPRDRVLLTQRDDFGAYVDIPLDLTQTELKFHVIDAAGQKNCGSDQSALISPEAASTGLEIWVVEDECQVFTSLPRIQRANLTLAKAHWLDEATFAWPRASASQAYRIFFAERGGLKVQNAAITGADEAVDLQVDPEPLSDELAARFPHLKAATVLRARNVSRLKAKQWLKGQMAIAQFNEKGELVQATGLQTPGVLDALYASPANRESALDANLGVTFSFLGLPRFALWAPTAKSVNLRVYENATDKRYKTIPMRENVATGVWEHQSYDVFWRNRAYYAYEISVFVPSTGKVETNLVTDPYSLSLTADSARSMVIDLNDAFLKPWGWEWHSSPALRAPEDTVIYETHVRDFSISDATVPSEHRGKFMAFTHSDSNGMRHLRSLREAGLNTIHLLPVFDIGTIPERAENQLVPAIDPHASPASESQQAAVTAVADKDGFNWGYDPVHYTAPEGSYATDAVDGRVRVVEFRRMVQALHRQGFRVVMDVVYNHTNASGQAPLSVLDRIVPGYYQRLDEKGVVATSTCCSNTASEHAMMEKLMIDSTRTWVEAYKVDGFRFDLMGHHMKRNMEKLQAELKRIRPDLYIYGEGWNFGEVADNARGVNATQKNMAGTGIGTYSDRMRDAVRGGGPFDSSEALRESQGYASGLYFSPNAVAAANLTSEKQLEILLGHKDLVRLGLAGTLSDYSFQTADGTTRSGRELDYNGQQAGYTSDPQEVINYVSKHDNQTLFDILQYKLPTDISLEHRVRHNVLALSTVLYAQGVPFFQAGDDILRSKSLERDSYNSGDWFNRLDFTYESNNWAVGLPNKAKDEVNWPIARELFAIPTLKPGKQEILAAHEAFKDMIRVRMSSPLFRLRTAEAVKARVHFLNTGISQRPELIVMKLSGTDSSAQRKSPAAKDPDLYVVFNSAPEPQNYTLPAVAGHDVDLHPVLASSRYAPFRQGRFEAASGSFTVPALTAAVFVDHGSRN